MTISPSDQPTHRDFGYCQVEVHVNQAGYLPHGTKTVVVESTTRPLEPFFWLLAADCTGMGYGAVEGLERHDRPFTAEPILYQGALRVVQGDFGTFLVGDFSDFTRLGNYEVIVKPKPPDRTMYHSRLFPISENVYRPVIDLGLDCFATQRCGPSTTGYHAPCHLDDGYVLRERLGAPGHGEGYAYDAPQVTHDPQAARENIDLVGGWHDASDLLKWADATIMGLIGMLEIAAHGDLKMRARIFDESRWGNLYFRKLQHADGYFCFHGIGGDACRYGNHWTDNLRGTPDDRPAVLEPGSMGMQHFFIIAQTEMNRVFGEWDREYGRQCLHAAIRCFDWARRLTSQNYLDLGSGAYAGRCLYAATGEAQYLDYTRTMADGFAALQQDDAGFFYRDSRRTIGSRNTFDETFGLIGFCRAIRTLRGKIDVSAWERVLRRHCDRHLLLSAGWNAFGIVPFQTCLEDSLLPGARGRGGHSYRYFMSRLNKFYLGNNPHLAGTGVALSMASEILGDPRYRDLAQRLFDWILGVNPFGLSFVQAVGVNPPEYLNKGCIPRTPWIPGAVMNGIVGDDLDRPDLQAGTYHTAEIWTPNTIQTMWLASELSHSSPRQKTLPKNTP